MCSSLVGFMSVFCCSLASTSSNVVLPMCRCRWGAREGVFFFRQTFFFFAKFFLAMKKRHLCSNCSNHSAVLKGGGTHGFYRYACLQCNNVWQSRRDLKGVVAARPNPFKRSYRCSKCGEFKRNHECTVYESKDSKYSQFDWKPLEPDNELNSYADNQLDPNQMLDGLELLKTVTSLF